MWLSKRCILHSSPRSCLASEVDLRSDTWRRVKVKSEMVFYYSSVTFGLRRLTTLLQPGPGLHISSWHSPERCVVTVAEVGTSLDQRWPRLGWDLVCWGHEGVCFVWKVSEWLTERLHEWRVLQLSVVLMLWLTVCNQTAEKVGGAYVMFTSTLNTKRFIMLVSMAGALKSFWVDFRGEKCSSVLILCVFRVLLDLLDQ